MTVSDMAVQGQVCHDSMHDSLIAKCLSGMRQDMSVACSSRRSVSRQTLMTRQLSRDCGLCCCPTIRHGRAWQSRSAVHSCAMRCSHSCVTSRVRVPALQPPPLLPHQAGSHTALRARSNPCSACRNCSTAAALPAQRASSARRVMRSMLMRRAQCTQARLHFSRWQQTAVLLHIPDMRDRAAQHTRLRSSHRARNVEHKVLRPRRPVQLARPVLLLPKRPALQRTPSTRTGL